MKALLSRFTQNSDGVTPSPSNSINRRDVEEDKRGRTISTTGYSDKHQNGATLYAQPQDLLYPSSTTQKNGSYEQKTKFQLVSGQRFGTGGVKTRPALSSSMRNNVGDVPKSPSSADPPLERRGTKILFDTLRGRKLPSGVDINGLSTIEMRNEYSSSTSNSNSVNNLYNVKPVHITDIRSQSTSALVRDKVKEVLPELPSKLDALDIPQHPLTTKAQISHQSDRFSKDLLSVRSKQGENGIVTSRGISSPSNGTSGSNLLFLEPPLQRSITLKSAPTTPQFSPDQEHFTASNHKKGEEAFSLKKSFSKRSRSKVAEQSKEERDVLGFSMYQLPKSPSAGFRAGPSQIPFRTPDLANELNELAVAHKEGLLGEEEYRMLRQSVFEKMAGRGEMEVPRESRLQGISKQSNGVPTKEDAFSVFSGSISMRSKTSATSKLASLFRRESKSDMKNYAGSSSLLSAGDSVHSGTAPSMRSRLSTSAALETQISQARRARTLYSGASVQGMEAGLLSVNHQGGRSIYSTSGASISSGNALLGANYTEKSADEIEAEIAVVEAEGKRILERFKSLQINALGRYNLSFSMIKQALEGIGLETELEAELLEDYVIIEKVPRSEKGLMENNGLQNHSNGGEITLGGRIHRKRSFGAKAVLNGRTENKGDSSPAPSSYKGIDSSNSNGKASDLQTDEEDPDLINLRGELKVIVRRRSEVAKKYADRLAFLRSTLRSAKIRQGLR